MKLIRRYSAFSILFAMPLAACPTDDSAGDTASTDTDTDTDTDADTDTDTGSGDTDSGDTDSGDTDDNDGFTFVTDDDAAGALVASMWPPVSFMIDLLGSSFGDGVCPAVTEAEGPDSYTITVVGDCTASDGTNWTGQYTMTAVETVDSADVTLVYLGWGTTDGASSHAVDGTLKMTGIVDGVGDVYVNHMETEGYVLTLVAGETSVLTYDSYSLDGEKLTETLLGEPGTLTVAGNVEVAGLGSYAIAADYEVTRECTEEFPSGGTATFTGSNVLTLALDGATDCDGCFPWSTDDGASGEFCSVELL